MTAEMIAPPGPLPDPEERLALLERKVRELDEALERAFEAIYEHQSEHNYGS